MPTESILLSYQSTTPCIKRYYTGYTKYYTEYYTDTTQSTNRVLTKNLLGYYLGISGTTHILLRIYSYIYDN